MSRSRKKPILKDKTNHTWYNRIIRRVQRMQIKQIQYLKDMLEYKISQPKELVNDWEVCDWKFDYRGSHRKDAYTPIEVKKLCCK